MTHSYKLLGTLDIQENGRSSELLKSSKGCALVTYLIITNQPKTREMVADLLWQGTSTTQSLKNLRSLLNRIKKWVPELEITRQSLTYRTHPDTTIDLVTLNKTVMAEPLLHSSISTLNKLNSALRLYQGDLLTGFFLNGAPHFEEWLLLERERLRLRILVAYDQLCTAYIERDEVSAALDVANRWLTIDPLDEKALRNVMRLLANNQQQQMAVQQYEISRQYLDKQMGVTPEAVTVTLMKQIKSGEFTIVGQEQIANENVKQNGSFDWDDIPLVGSFLGRTVELDQLHEWLTRDRSQVVVIHGIGGIGKTTLSAQTARAIGKYFDVIIWRSLVNAPTFDELIPPILQILSGHTLSDIPSRLNDRLALLLSFLRKSRCLFVLDNVESIMSEGRSITFTPGYEAYEQLFAHLARQKHQSSLLITTREIPVTFSRLTGNDTQVRTLPLAGLQTSAGQELLQSHGFILNEQAAKKLITRYSGNPLALNLVAQTIKEIYDGDPKHFLDNETLIFDDIRDVLDQQCSRLSALEHDILIWLAIAREPLSAPDLLEMLNPSVRQRLLIEALRTLQHRSLIEKNRSGFLLQNVIMEYLTDKIIEQAVSELKTGQMQLFNSHALLQAQAKSYVRHSQKRLLLQPIAEQLLVNPRKQAIHDTFKQRLDELRKDLTPGYAAGNILNLLLHMDLDVTGYNFSQLTVWQAYLQDTVLHKVNFAQADLSNSLFTDVFGFIYSVAFSPDGQLLAAGTVDGQIQIWNIATGQPILTFTSHSDSVWSVVFSPDGRILASSSFDRTVRLWNLDDLNVPTIIGTNRVLAGHEDGVCEIVFTPDGKFLVSSSADYTIRVWDVQTGLTRAILKGHTDNVETVAISPDGQYLASGGRDQIIRLWDIANILQTDMTNIIEMTGEVSLQILHDHTNWVNSLTFSPDGNLLASGGEDGAVILWEMPNTLDNLSGSKEIKRDIIWKNKAGVKSVSFSPDSCTLAIGCNDQTIRIWDAPSRKIINTLQGHTNWVYSVCFSPDGEMLASGSWDHSVRLWQVHTGQELRQFQGTSNLVFSVAFSADGTMLASGSANKRVHLWDITNDQNYTKPRIRHSLAAHSDWVWKVVFSPNGRYLASASMDRTARIWDTQTGQLLHTFQGHTDGLQAIAFAPDGRTLATGGLDQNIRLWDIPTGQIRATLHGHTGWCLCLRFSSDGQTLASAGADHTVRLWNLAQSESLVSEISSQILYEHDDGVQEIDFSPDGKLLASASWDKSVRVWDIDLGVTRHILHGHTDAVRTIEFSSDGQKLLSGGNDKRILLWDVCSGERLHSLEGHNGWIISAKFDQSDQFVASAGDKTIRMWDVNTGDFLHTLNTPNVYSELDITGVTGLTAVQKANLKELGAVDDG